MAGSSDDLKRMAAAAALDLVQPGMRLGLGTGSTAAWFVTLLGERVAAGLSVVGVPTSGRTREQAAALGIPLTTLDDVVELDLTVDGADELDSSLTLIKGGGGALLREKIVASASRHVAIIADAGKLVDRLGRFPLPVEIVPFGWKQTLAAVESHAALVGPAPRVSRRADASGTPFLTDNGNFILDCAFGEISDPEDLADLLETIPGVVEHGLFIDIATIAFVAGPEGVRTLGPAGWSPRAAV